VNWTYVASKYTAFDGIGPGFSNAPVSTTRMGTSLSISQSWTLDAGPSNMPSYCGDNAPTYSPPTVVTCGHVKPAARIASLIAALTAVHSMNMGGTPFRQGNVFRIRSALKAAFTSSAGGSNMRTHTPSTMARKASLSTNSVIASVIGSKRQRTSKLSNFRRPQHPKELTYFFSSLSCR
jgi:hypothetical protein